MFRKIAISGFTCLLFAGASSTPLHAQEKYHFTLCDGAVRTNCVIDGDTFWMDGEKIRIADIDTAETMRPKCAAEYVLGKKATYALIFLLNERPFTLTDAEREHDFFGRRLRILLREGQSIGKILIERKLARPWTGRRKGWC